MIIERRQGDGALLDPLGQQSVDNLDLLLVKTLIGRLKHGLVLTINDGPIPGGVNFAVFLIRVSMLDFVRMPTKLTTDILGGLDGNRVILVATLTTTRPRLGLGNTFSIRE